MLSCPYIVCAPLTSTSPLSVSMSPFTASRLPIFTVSIALLMICFCRGFWPLDYFYQLQICTGRFSLPPSCEVDFRLSHWSDHDRARRVGLAGEGLRVGDGRCALLRHYVTPEFLFRSFLVCWTRTHLWPSPKADKNNLNSGNHDKNIFCWVFWPPSQFVIVGAYLTLIFTVSCIQYTIMYLFFIVIDNFLNNCIFGGTWSQLLCPHDAFVIQSLKYLSEDHHHLTSDGLSVHLHSLAALGQESWSLPN